MIANIRLQDVLDILFLTIVAYYLYVWFRGTKAFKALAGLLALAIIYTAARAWGLFLTTWMFEILWQASRTLRPPFRCRWSSKICPSAWKLSNPQSRVLRSRSEGCEKTPVH
ncbi:MAG: hypothetical protein LJE88_17125 [Deltaproteobacteria bacterium]|nr:hypothetical protein [Deltaproteobacteria bacterium]